MLGILAAAQDELGRLTDHVLVTGVRRWRPLADRLVVTAAGSALILTVTGLVGALIAPAVIDGRHVAVRAFGYTVGQWPAAMAAAGWTVLLVGHRPRSTWPAWIPPAGSGVLALLGRLLGVPGWLQDLGLFQHVPDVASPDPDGRGLLLLLAVTAAACLLGLAASTRRNVVTG